MNDNRRRLAVLLAAAALSSCAVAPRQEPPKAAAAPLPAAALVKLSTPPPNIGCQPEPQWIIRDDKGKPTRLVFVCFRDDGALLWSGRPLTEKETADFFAQYEANRPPKAFVKTKKKASK